MHLDDSGSVTDRYAAGAVCGLAMAVTQFGMNHLGICAIPGCRGAFVNLGPSRVSRYCPKHLASKANVTAIRNHRSSAVRFPASTAVG